MTKKERSNKKGWDKNCGIYNCSDGQHNSFWLSIIKTPEWSAWEQEVSRRRNYHNKKKSKIYSGVWDVDESRECGWISVKHIKDFLKFLKSAKKK